MQETAAIFDGGYQLTLWPETPGFESGVFGPAPRQGVIADHAVCMQSVVCLDQGRSAEITPFHIGLTVGFWLDAIVGCPVQDRGK